MLLYRFLISVFAVYVLFREFRRGGLSSVRARLGAGSGPETPHLWWHGASNGELASARPVLETLLSRAPGLHVVITANTETGCALAAGWGLDRVHVRPAPLDLAWVTKRFLRRWRVTAHVTLESELWPNRILRTDGPIIVLGARMSPGTARTWARAPQLARRLLSHVSFLSPQDQGSRKRFRDLGLPDAASGAVADLKALYARPDIAGRPEIQAFDRDHTWLAASTHEGEEEIVLEAHRRARENDPMLRLILAPRHPARGDMIDAMIRRTGLSSARRSRSGAPGMTDVFLADTMGEMALWYAAAGRVFIGGTLTNRGGHTPYEPAAFGAALLHGPDTRNFAAAFTRLAGVSVPVSDAPTLAAGLDALTEPAIMNEAGAEAALALRQETDLDALCDAVLERLSSVHGT